MPKPHEDKSNNAELRLRLSCCEQPMSQAGGGVCAGGWKGMALSEPPALKRS